MSELSRKDRHDYSKYDEMSTESLEEILRLDFQASEEHESDTDAIMYILEVIEKRNEQPPAPETDTAAAWERFQTKYLPYADGRSLYDFDDDEPCGTEPAASDVVIPDKKNHLSVRRTRRLGRIAAIAAAIAVLFTLMTATAYALGYDLWGAFAQWTRDTFSFVPASETHSADNEENLPITEEEFPTLQAALDLYGITEPLAPTWVPDGFVLDSVSVDESSNPRVIMFQASYRCEERWIMIQINMHQDASDVNYWSWEKDRADVSTIEIENCTFYIMENAGRQCAIWSNGSFEGYITGDITSDELSELVKSIYVRNE